MWYLFLSTCFLPAKFGSEGSRTLYFLAKVREVVLSDSVDDADEVFWVVGGVEASSMGAGDDRTSGGGVSMTLQLVVMAYKVK
jgi:hypothetical protein